MASQERQQKTKKQQKQCVILSKQQRCSPYATFIHHIIFFIIKNILKNIFNSLDTVTNGHTWTFLIKDKLFKIKHEKKISDKHAIFFFITSWLNQYYFSLSCPNKETHKYEHFFTEKPQTHRLLSFLHVFPLFLSWKVISFTQDEDLLMINKLSSSRLCSTVWQHYFFFSSWLLYRCSMQRSVRENSRGNYRSLFSASSK